MNREQVQLRIANVRQRLDELEEQRLQAGRNRHWYRSESFARALQRGDADALRPAGTDEQWAAAMDRALRRDLVQELQEQAAGLPEHLGSRSLRPHPVRVAMIADEFLYDSLRDTAQVTYLRPETFREVAREADLLLIASTWRGLDDEWIGASSPDGLVRTEVIPAFREAGVPVAFYSKEDPPNYVRFRGLAQEADFIFTSAEEVVADYVRDCPRAQAVRALTFGVNPLVHNPIGSRRHRRGEVLFAGSWLEHKYPQRKRAARRIFDGVVEAGRDLLILDRNSTLGNPRHFFPQEFFEFIGPGVPHADLMRIQRMVDVQINLNSVANSTTMFANRAVELQAMGAAVISNYSRALNNLFPGILIADSRFETAAMLEQLQGEDLYRLQAQGIHHVFWEHTSHQRMGELLETIGLPTTATHGRAVLVADEITDAVRQTAAAQSVPVELMSAQQLREARSAEDLQRTVLLPVRADYRYHHDYARSQAAAFAYADVDFTAKNGLETATGAGSQDDFERIDRAADPHRSALWADSETARRWTETGVVAGSGLGLDPFGVLTGPEQITLRGAAGPEQPLLTVVVPVYNNGRHLEGKCFRSLQRSSIFERMEVLLVDDGSTDGITPQVIRDLERRFPQVRTHFNPAGGSGSASRPRNQGLELARAPYVTYLDPDNEAVNDGYARLLEMVRSADLDFAIGDMLKFSYTARYVNNARILDEVLVPDEEAGGRMVPDGAIASIDFQPMSIQALVADTAWLRSTGIEQPVGALGQDSLAFQEMLHAARRIDTVQLPIHVYYGAVANSMVNTVSPGFYRKYLPLEEARGRWLRENGLMDEYIARRARPFLSGWLVGKYNTAVAPEDREECFGLLQQLGAFYGIELEPVDPESPDSDIQLVPLETSEDDEPGPAAVSGSEEPMHQDRTEVRTDG
ncbi:glycosyltransferase [Kocuria palustris]|uniref:glycosyltransferase n=1 Tax=Kocuria palustris TaxID=71999 RepID=UPI00119E5406|nr:glycosyltransferase [Kocuria palustris]